MNGAHSNDMKYLQKIRNGESLQLVPEESRSLTLCIEAIVHHPLALEFVPDEILNEIWEKDHFIILNALKKNWRSIQFISDNARTGMIAIAAFCGFTQDSTLNKNEYFSNYIPNQIWRQMINQSLRDKALKKAINIDWHYIEYIPEQWKTDQLCFFAVEKNISALDFISEKQREKIILEMIKKDWKVIEKIKDDMKTESICMAAVLKNKDAFTYVPKEFLVNIREKYYLHLLKKNWEVIKDIPEEERNEDICFAAVLNDWAALQYVPEQIRISIQQEVLLNLVKIASTSTQTFPPKRHIELLQLWSTYRDQIKKLFELPVEIRGEISEEILIQAIRINFRMMDIIPVDMLNKNICLAAIKVDERCIYNVPKIIEMREVFIEAIGKYGSDLANKILHSLPNYMKTEDFYIELFEKANINAKLVPEDMLVIIADKVYMNYIKSNAKNLKNAMPYLSELVKEKITVNGYTAAVRYDWRVIEFVPDNLIKKNNMIKIALEADPNALYIIKDRIKDGNYISEIITDDIIDKVIQNDHEHLYVGEHELLNTLRSLSDDVGFQMKIDGKLNDALYVEAVIRNRNQLNLIDEKIVKNASINGHINAIKKDVNALTLMPKEYFNENSVENILLDNHMALEKLTNIYNNKVVLLKVLNKIGFEKFISESSDLHPILQKLVSGSEYESKVNTMINDKIYLDEIRKLKEGNIDRIEERIINNASDQAHYEAVGITYNALKFIPKRMLTNDFLVKLLKEDLMVLQVFAQAVEDKERLINVVEQVGLQYLISENFKLFEVLASLSDDKQFNNKINKCIAAVNYLVVTDDSGFSDHEVADGYHVYSSKRQNKGKFIHVDRSDLEKFMKVWSNNVSNEKQYLNLILLGHCNSTANALAGMSVAEISNFIKMNPVIKHVLLQGCNTVKSRPLDREQEMQRNYLETLTNQPEPFYLKLAKSDIDLASVKFREKLVKFPVPYLYVLQKCKEENKYNLLFVNKKDNQAIQYETYTLTEDQLKLLKAKNKNKKIDFPPKHEMIDYVVAKKPSENMSLTHQAIQEIIKPAFEKKNPKKMLPFLSSIEINEIEREKLEVSLLQKLVVELESQLEGTEREISVKGYTDYLHVDTKEGKFHVASTHLYKQYKNQAFFTKEDNIDRKKMLLDQDRKKKEFVERSSKQSLAKGIKINLKFPSKN